MQSGDSDTFSGQPNETKSSSSQSQPSQTSNHVRTFLQVPSSSFHFDDSEDENEDDEKSSLDQRHSIPSNSSHHHSVNSKSYHGHNRTPSRTRTASQQGHARSRSIASHQMSSCQEEEEEDRRYAILKLRSLIKKQETLADHSREIVEHSPTGTWFDSIF